MPTSVSLGDQSKYPVIFDLPKISEKIQSSSFPVVRRSPSKKCDGNPWLQKGSRSPVIEHGEMEEIWENQSSLTASQISFYSTPQGIVDLNREGIEVAIDRRIALFFQQAILCYNMPFVFSARGADDQIGSATNIELSVNGQQKSIVHKREAAHSSTIPTLIARPKNGTHEQAFVYLKGGSSYAQHNATIGMHECINGADELIDGKGQDGRLRETAVKILNLVAGGLNPIKATKSFLQEFESQVTKTSQSLQPTDKRKAVLEIYKEKSHEIAEEVSSDKSLFDRLIGIVIDSQDPKEKVIREVIYQKRYDIIRLQELVESRIGKRIFDTQEQMRSGDRSFLELLLLKEFAEKKERKVLEKLLAKTAAIFEKEYESQLFSKQKSAFKSFQTRMQNLQENYASHIDKLKRELRNDFRELSSAEFAYRAQVFKDLRTRVRNWTQSQFCEHYYQTTSEKVSQTWVSRMEQLSRMNTKISYKTPLNQRCRYVTLEDAKRCALTFDVDSGLFLPCLITSD